MIKTNEQLNAQEKTSIEPSATIVDKQDEESSLPNNKLDSSQDLHAQLVKFAAKDLVHKCIDRMSHDYIIFFTKLILALPFGVNIALDFLLEYSANKYSNKSATSTQNHSPHQELAKQIASKFTSCDGGRFILKLILVVPMTICEIKYLFEYTPNQSNEIAVPHSTEAEITALANSSKVSLQAIDTIDQPLVLNSRDLG